MRSKTKIWLSIISGTFVLSTSVTTGIILGTNLLEWQKGGTIYNSLAGTKKLKDLNPPQQSFSKQKPKQEEPKVKDSNLEPQLQPNPIVVPEGPPRGEGSYGKDQTSLSVEEVLQKYTDLDGSKSKEFENPTGEFKTRYGVGTNFRSIARSPLGDSKWDDSEFYQGSQDSAQTLGRLVRAGYTLESFPTIKEGETIKLKDLKNLRTNSLRMNLGQRILNLTQEDKQDIIKDINENVRVVDTYSRAIRGSLKDIVNLANELKQVDNIANLTPNQRAQVLPLIAYLLSPNSNEQYRNYPTIPNKNIGAFPTLYRNVNIPNYGVDLITEQTEYQALKQVLANVREITIHDLTSDNIKFLEEGYMPSSIQPDGKLTTGSWQPRPAFVNGVQFQTTLRNMSRFIPITSNWQRSQDDVLQLNFQPGSGEGVSGYKRSDLGMIEGFDKVGRVLKYVSALSPNNPKENRYIIEIGAEKNTQTGIQHLGDKTPTELIAAAVKKIQNDQPGADITENGIGVAIHNINATTGIAAANFVKAMPRTVKSLTLFYSWNNPLVANALIQNPNFPANGSNNLTELNIYTDLDVPISRKNPAVEKPTNLNRIDPRVYQRVNPTANDYRYNAIYTTMAVSANETDRNGKTVKQTSRREISNIMNYVYLQAWNRREFQGEIPDSASVKPSGAYPVNWDFSENNQWDFNNVVIPNIPNFENGKFTKVYYSPLVNGIAAPLDLQHLIVDNTSKVDYEIDNVRKGVFYRSNSGGLETPAGTGQSQNYLRVIGSSSRGKQSDANTILNYVNTAWQYIRNVDVRDYTDQNGQVYKTPFQTLEDVKAVNWPITIGYIYYGNNQVYRNPNAANQNLGSSVLPSNNPGTFAVDNVGNTEILGDLTPQKTGSIQNSVFDSVIKNAASSAEGKNGNPFISVNTPEYDAVKNDIYNTLNDYSQRIIINTNQQSRNPTTNQLMFDSFGKPIPVVDYGTAWILDYQKTSDGSYPKTFYYATNMHVVARMNHKKDTLNKDQSGPIKNNESVEFRKSILGQEEIKNFKLKDSEYPELVFSATNFLNNGSDTIEYTTQGYQNAQKLKNYFKDFAIIKVTYETSERAKEATSGFADKYKTPKIKFNKISESLLNKQTSQGLSDYQRNYSLGYPAGSNGLMGGSNSGGSHATVNKRVGNVDGKHGQTFANNRHFQFINNYGQTIPGIYDQQRADPPPLLWQGKTYYRFNTVYGLNNSGFAGGGSGTLVVDGNYQVLGIYWGNIGNTQSAFVDPLVSPEIKDRNGNTLIYEYDLINGGGKNQANSFKKYLTDAGLLKDSWLFNENEK